MDNPCQKSSIDLISILDQISVCVYLGDRAGAKAAYKVLKKFLKKPIE